MMTASERALLRIREEMTERKITQRDLADSLQCSQGKIAKLLNSRVMLRVDDLDALARAVGLTLVEAVRDRGLEFYAEMTPTELRLFEKLRRYPTHLYGLMQMLDIAPGETRAPTVEATPRRGPGRPLKGGR